MHTRATYTLPGAIATPGHPGGSKQCGHGPPYNTLPVSGEMKHALKRTCGFGRSNAISGSEGADSARRRAWERGAIVPARRDSQRQDRALRATPALNRYDGAAVGAVRREPGVVVVRRREEESAVATSKQKQPVCSGEEDAADPYSYKTPVPRSRSLHFFRPPPSVQATSADPLLSTGRWDFVAPTPAPFFLVSDPQEVWAGAVFSDEVLYWPSKMKITAGLLLLLALAAPHHCKRTKRWDESKGQNQEGWVRGTAGVDYPDYKEIPRTSFRCSQQPYEGMYADLEAQCQVYHVCHNGRKESFLCGPGTIFNQQIRACDYWYSFECDEAPNWYYLNAEVNDQPTCPAALAGQQEAQARQAPEAILARVARVDTQEVPALRGQAVIPVALGDQVLEELPVLVATLVVLVVTLEEVPAGPVQEVTQALELKDLALADTLDLEPVDLVLAAIQEGEATALALALGRALVDPVENQLADLAVQGDQAVTVLVVQEAPVVMEATEDLEQVLEPHLVALAHTWRVVVLVLGLIPALVPRLPKVDRALRLVDMVSFHLGLARRRPRIQVHQEPMPIRAQAPVQAHQEPVAIPPPTVHALPGTAIAVSPGSGGSVYGGYTKSTGGSSFHKKGPLELESPHSPGPGSTGFSKPGARRPISGGGFGGGGAYGGPQSFPGSGGYDTAHLSPIQGAQPGGGGAWQGPEYPSPNAGTGGGGGGYYTSDSGAYSGGSAYPGQDASGQLPGGAPQRPRGGGRGRRPQGGYGSPMMMGGAGGD
ncbi:hypothetical protein HPB49_000944 [Dermacentor silvarum]|uniref:Uncharacterized protein n=1 Tax=Dermacentor silvarum TaxID=543639 RepID=A0ACB8DST5_DERSI|nr:hypothetical protein HPB49_000944 [Dermacentor silvarum]